MALTQVSTDGVKNDAISHNKIPANAIQASELADNAVDTAAIADNTVTEVKLGVSNSPTNGYFLSAQSGNSGGLTWAQVDLSSAFDKGGGDTITGDFTIASGTTNKNINVDVSDKIKFDDNLKATFGSSDDLQIYHNGSHNYLDSVNGNIYLRVNSTENAIKCTENGNVEIAYDGSKKFETTSGGIDVTGAITVNGSALGSGGLKSTDSDSGHLTSGSQSLSGSYSEVMELQVTPSSSSNKVAIFSSMVIEIAGSHTWGGPAANHKLTRTISGTETTLIDQNILYQRDNVNAAKYLMAPSSLDYMDSPNTTSQVTYKIYAKYSDTATSGNVRSYTSIAMEVSV